MSDYSSNDEAKATNPPVEEPQDDAQDSEKILSDESDLDIKPKAKKPAKKKETPAKPSETPTEPPPPEVKN